MSAWLSVLAFDTRTPMSGNYRLVVDASTVSHSFCHSYGEESENAQILSATVHCKPATNAVDSFLICPFWYMRRRPAG